MEEIDSLLPLNVNLMKIFCYDKIE
jgi:hypothetical protein